MEVPILVILVLEDWSASGGSERITK